MATKDSQLGEGVWQTVGCQLLKPAAAAEALLLKDSETNGLCVLGDGGTIKQSPLTNILAGCGNVSPVALKIEHSSDHHARGGRKTGAYLSDVFSLIMLELDPERKLI